MDGGAWQGTVHGVEKGRTRLSDFHFQKQNSLYGKEKKKGKKQGWRESLSKRKGGREGEWKKIDFEIDKKIFFKGEFGIIIIIKENLKYIAM